MVDKVVVHWDDGHCEARLSPARWLDLIKDEQHPTGHDPQIAMNAINKLRLGSTS
jgi:hypothetical protein